MKAAECFDCNSFLFVIVMSQSPDLPGTLAPAYFLKISCQIKMLCRDVHYVQKKAAILKSSARSPVFC